MNNALVKQNNTEIVLTVKVYCLTFSQEPEYDSRMRVEDIRNLFVSVNTLWKCARIRWKLLSCQKRIIDTQASGGLMDVSDKRELRLLFGRISPVIPVVLQKRIWNVCLLSSFPVRSWGVYLPETKVVFLSESSRHEQPNAVTLAHELGHMLGLPHVSDEGNVMNPHSLRALQDMLHSSTGLMTIFSLDEKQIAAARLQAALGPY